MELRTVAARIAVSTLLVSSMSTAAASLGSPLEARGAPESGAQQRPRFEATVNRVRVNVIVTDREGRFVDDLRAEDFTIYEDGEPREVLELQLIDLAAGEIIPLLAANTGPGGEAVGGEAVGDRAGARADDPERDPTPARDVPVIETTADADSVAADFGAIVFFIDFTGLNHIIKMHFTDQWGRYLETKQSTGIPQAVYLVDQNGLLDEIVPLTTDMELLRAAQQTVEAAPLTFTYFDGVPDGGVLSAESPTSDGGLRETRFYEYDRAHYTFRLLAQFCDALASRPGRTALVWVSRGVTIRGTFRDRGYEPNATLLRLQRELDEAANGANVSIYAVDPSRYIDLLGGDPSQPRAGSPGDELGNTLRHAATETGGEHFVAWADFGAVVDRIEQDSGRYYLLTYPGPEPGGDGEYHEIRVAVNRPGVSIRSKRGYTDHPDEERRSRFVSAALMMPGTVNNLPVSAQVFRGEAGGRTEVRVAVAVDGVSLGIRVDDDGELIQRIEVHGALLDEDEDMEVAEEMHRQVTEKVEGDPPVPVDWLISQQEWKLEPGTYDLRIMALDDATGRVGTAQLSVEIPEIDDNEWRLHDVMLLELPDAADEEADEEGIPVVQGRVRDGREVTATIVVDEGEAPVVNAWVRRAGGSAEADAEPALTDQALPRRRGEHRGTFTLPDLAPGEYVLELRISDSPASREEVVEIPLRVVAGA